MTSQPADRTRRQRSWLAPGTFEGEPGSMRSDLAWFCQGLGVLILAALVWFSWANGVSGDGAGLFVLAVAAALGLTWWGFQARFGGTDRDRH